MVVSLALKSGAAKQIGLSGLAPWAEAPQADATQYLTPVFPCDIL
jgi:hypothetical protein